jgi:diaminohydroxyphosphoribosylaminopyrimidine deaminase/5-amino-6-(5-phosphoribosylamino)uracil reductase
VVHAFVAPILAGGRHAKPPVEGEGIERIAAGRRALSTEVERIGDDVLISARFTEW